MDQAAAAKALGLAPEKVKLNTLPAGGGFGRRANPASDYVIEACEIARDAKVPVKVVWTREDDIRGGYYRPMYVHRVEAGLDAKGALVGWNHAIVGQSIIAGTAFEPFLVKDGIDDTSRRGRERHALRHPQPRRDAALAEVGDPVAVVALGGPLAHRLRDGDDDRRAGRGRGPGSGRLPPQAAREAPARRSRPSTSPRRRPGWGTPLPKGRARGIAVHESFGSVCAQVAEVSLEDGAVKVHRVVAAFDCGLVVNPLTVEAQVQGAIAFGLSAALHGEITLKDGQVEQSNFHDYRCCA